MKMNKKDIVLIFLPLIVLLGWVVSLQYSFETNPRTRLPVEGYDPRDILAGRYMQIRTDYSSFESECVRKKEKTKSGRWRVIGSYNQPAFFCVDEKKIYVDKKPENCKIFIKGRCSYGRFTDDVSRFYVPELNAKELERLLRNEVNTEIEVSVSPKGQAIPTDLFYDGVSYKQFLK